MFRRKKEVKYNNTKCEYDGFKFDSKKECERYKELKQLEKKGDIVGLELQPKFVIFQGYKYKGKNIRDITYTGDFAYYDEVEQVLVCEDVKSKATAKDKVYCLKKKMIIKKLMEIGEKEGFIYEFREVVR